MAGNRRVMARSLEVWHTWTNGHMDEWTNEEENEENEEARAKGQSKI